MELPVVHSGIEIRPPPIEKAAVEQSLSRGIELPMDVAPDCLSVPKALKYPERLLLLMEKVDKEGDDNGAQVVSGRDGSPVSSSSSPRKLDSDASDPFSDHESVPHDRELDAGVPSGTPPRSPLIVASSPSMVERPAGYDPNRIPSSIFSSRSSNPADWSVASNESLFSIHTGNNSFSRDHTAFLLYKSGELTKLDEVFSVPTPLPPVSESLSLQRDSVSSSVASNPLKLPKQREPSSEGNSPILGKSSGKGHLSPSGDARNSVSLSARSDGSATTTSTSSFAFPILAGSERNSSSLYTTDGAMERPKEAPPKTSQPQQQNHRTTISAALSNCFSCFSCFSFCCNFSLK